MQLDTYAEFTAHENIQRRHTFARTLCADELYNLYYSGSRYDIDFVVSTATIVGPFSLVAIILAILIVRAVVQYKKLTKVSHIAKNTLRGKTLVAVVSISIYICVYILILDILAIYTVTASKHEYAPELSGRSLSFNLYVSFITLGCDLLSSIVFLVFPMIVILVKEFTSSCRESCEGCAENRFSCFGEKEKFYYLFLVAPVICVTSHFGYILLAWTTQPSKSTTTLILYYFLFSYLYLMLRLTYKLGYRLIRIINRKSQSGEQAPGQEVNGKGEQAPGQEVNGKGEQAPGQEVNGKGEQAPGQEVNGKGEQAPGQEVNGKGEQAPGQEVNGKGEQAPGQEVNGKGEQAPGQEVNGKGEQAPGQEVNGKGEQAPGQEVNGKGEQAPGQEVNGKGEQAPGQEVNGKGEQAPGQEVNGKGEQAPGQEVNGKGEQAPGQEVNGKNNKPIRVRIFLLTLLLGIVYLGLAVIFILVVYLMPLASEDLYSYLFSGIQFMIVVVSTQYAYNLFAGKTFSFKKVLKHAKDIFYQRVR